MRKNKFGEMIFDQNDLCDLILQGREIWNLTDVVVADDIDIKMLIQHLENPGELASWHYISDETQSIAEFDSNLQSKWFMPQEYQELDIAQYVLKLCDTQEELQRCGEELLLFQEKNLFDLLRYLKYLVDVMEKHQIIWGVGRGSSVASFVLFKLGVHRVNSMYYDLSINEFLR